MEKSKLKHRLKCPVCKKPVIWEDNPYRPFCSERCHTIDLGNWADGSYAIKGKPLPDEREQ